MKWFPSRPRSTAVASSEWHINDCTTASCGVTLKPAGTHRSEQSNP